MPHGEEGGEMELRSGGVAARSARTGLAAAIVAAAAFAFPGVASATVFNDTAADSGTAGDVTSLEVTNDARGRVTFRLTFGNRPNGLEPEDFVVVFLNTDRNAATGDPEGDDFALQFSQGAFLVRGWTGSQFAAVEAPEAVATSRGGTITLTLPKADLGNTAGFEIVVFSVRIVNNAIESGEAAPDAGEWMYQLVVFCVVPNVRGKTLAAARTAIRRANCAVGRVSRKTASARKGRVTAQSPRVGTTRARGARVNLVVSKGPKKK
jgi:hypothetical protein